MGERLAKSQVINNALTHVKLYWSMGGNTLAEADASGNITAEYVYFGGKRVARIDLPANTVHYYLSDHLGSTSIVASAAGVVEEESDYYPFGTEVVVIGPGLNDYKFTGKERDTETGLDYFGARYYSNGLGRWVTPDWAAKPAAVPYAVLGDPQSLNLYSYVRNIPTTNGDPDGHFTDFYDTNGKKLGSDGVNNGAVAIAPYGVDKTSDGTVNVATTCAGGCVTVEASTGSAIQASVARTEAPSGADTKGGFHEEGFTQDKDGTVHVAAPGPAARPGDSEAHITKTLTSKTAIDEHTHPSGTKSGAGTTTLGGTSFNPKPSDKDIKGARSTPDPGQQIMHIEASAGEKTVYFYDERGVYAHVPLDAFPK